MAKSPKGIEIAPRRGRDQARLLTSEALEFIATLDRASGEDRQRLLSRRAEIRALSGKAALPGFMPATSAIRTAAWKVPPAPRDLVDLRTVVVAPPSRRELLAGLNSGARLCLADFHDAATHTWEALLGGQINLMDRWTSDMSHTDPATGRRVSLAQRLAALMVRTRPLLADEPRLLVDGKPVAAGIFDAGLYLFHNANTALAKASGPYLCLPCIQSPAEARAWNDILLHAQSLLGLPAGSVRIGAMIDQVYAAFAADEIAYELREHMSAVLIGGERYAQSLILLNAGQKSFAIADGPPPGLMGHCVNAAHRRGIAMIAPLTRQSETARADAELAVREGADGILLPGPQAVAAVAGIFDDGMPTPNQLYVSRDELAIRPADLLNANEAHAEEARFRAHVAAALRFAGAWLTGSPAAEGSDAARFELLRSQLWLWLRNGMKLDSGSRANEALLEDSLLEAMQQLRGELGEDEYRAGRFRDAASLLRTLVLANALVPDFMPLAFKKLA